MYQVKMVGTTAQIYADQNGILKNYNDIQIKLKKLCKQFQVDSIAIDEDVGLSDEEVKKLTNGFALKEIQNNIDEQTDEFKFVPIRFENIKNQFFSLLGKDHLALVLCFIPLLLVSTIYYFLAPTLILNSFLNNSLISILTIFSILGLGYVKTITLLHHYFLSQGERQSFFQYLLVNKKDFSFIFYGLIIELRVMSFLACIFIPLLLIMSFNPYGNFDNSASLGVLVTLVIAFIFISLFSNLSARYSLALPAIIANRKNCRTSWSYDVTKGNGWRIGILVFFFPAIIELAIYNLNVDKIFIINIVARVLYLTISVGMLVLCFKHITEICIKNNSQSN